MIMMVSLIFLPTTQALAGNKIFGQECDSNSDCQFGDCESAIGARSGKSYCDCNDLTGTKATSCELNYNGQPLSGGEWRCSEGMAESYDLDYCYSTSGDPSDIRFVVPPTNDVSAIDKALSYIFDSGASNKIEVTNIMEDITDKLAITIPGLNFTKLESAVDEEGYLYIPWIGEYIAAMYKFGVAMASIVAVIVIIMAGVQIILSGGGEGKTAGYKRIGQVVLGLMILWGSYAIMYTINPALVSFTALRIKYIEPTYLNDANFSLGSENPTEAPPNPALEAVAVRVAEKLGINGCLLSRQLGMESGWVATAKTACCYGIGQVHWKNALHYLTNPKTRAIIISTHSAGCPTCPPPNATTAQLSSWLLSDPEGNIIVSALIRKENLKPNPIAATVMYGAGAGTYWGYGKYKGCKVENISEEDFLNKLKSGTTLQSIIDSSCIPPDSWPVQKGSDCTLCCNAEIKGSCEFPKFTPQGRKGECREGKNKGQICYASKMSSYVVKYGEIAKKCIK